MYRLPLFALLAGTLAAPAVADTVTGEILAFDRVAQIMVLDDKSVWSLRDGGAEAPEGLEAGDTVTLTFQSVSDNGYGKITQIAVGE